MLTLISKLLRKYIFDSLQTNQDSRSLRLDMCPYDSQVTIN